MEMRCLEQIIKIDYTPTLLKETGIDLKPNNEIKYCEVCGKPLNKKVVIDLCVKSIEIIATIPCH